MHMIIFVVLQLGLFLFLASVFIRSMATSKSTKTVFISAIGLTILMGLCFLNYEMSSFNNEPYFQLFTVLASVGIVSFWLSKSPLKFSRKIQYILQIGTGLLFWLSFFTVIKFMPYLPFVWFPALGIMAIAPLFFTLMALEEILRNKHSNHLGHPLTSLGASLGLLLLLQFVLNGVTTTNWVLIELFNPTNTVV